MEQTGAILVINLLFHFSIDNFSFQRQSFADTWFLLWLCGIVYTQSVCFAFLYILQISKFYPNGGLSGFCLDFGETNFIRKIFLVKCFRVFGMIRNFFQLNHQRYKNFEYVSSKICLIFSHFTPPYYIYFSFVTPLPPFFLPFFNTNINFICLFTFNSIITNQSLTLIPFPEGKKNKKACHWRETNGNGFNFIFPILPLLFTFISHT